ncbi:MAG: sigma-54 dependent transcriptional regulator [Syntrophales bacterium]|nr:sigma-54 dependent transcriptional regulator [Syntrophales bacterium]
MSKEKLLVVDDDSNLSELIKMRLESAGYEVITALNGDEAIARAMEETISLSIVDLKLVHKDGISVMEQLHSINPHMPVIILTAHGSIESAVEAMKKGAFNYLTKPFNPKELLFQVEKALENRRLTSEIERLKGLLKEKYDFQNIIAKSEKMRHVLEQVSHIAKTDSSVCIFGESGTGKELIAKAIHLASARKDKPFVAINCAAIPETLLESELFGHEKGAFTGAVRSTKGLFAQGHEGTIFWDEIGDMPLSLQAKLLRVLQDQRISPVGSEKVVEVDTRIIVATNKDLEAEVKKGFFREDLFYRIHVIPVHMPPLRERKEDIPCLAEYFIHRFNRRMKKKVNGMTPSSMQKLMSYNWPGNVRELENTIEYAMAMSQRDLITEDGILQTKDVPNKLHPLKEARATFEKGYLINLLETTKGNVSRAAELAGKYRADFYSLLKKHGLNPPDFKKPQ